MLKQIFVFYLIFSNWALTLNAFNCHLPDGCRIESINIEENSDMNDIGNRIKKFIMLCDINSNEYRFEFKDAPKFIDISVNNRQYIHIWNQLTEIYNLIPILFS